MARIKDNGEDDDEADDGDSYGGNDKDIDDNYETSTTPNRTKMDIEACLGFLKYIAYRRPILIRLRVT